MNNELPSKHVFCSYSHRDAQNMSRVRRALEKVGITVWTDEGLTPGTESWKTTIETKIRSAAGVVVILSPSANESMWVERELEYASIHRIKIFPVLVEGEPGDAIPIELINSQWIDIRNKADFSKQVHQLVLAIRAESAGTGDIPKYPAPGNPPIRPRPAKPNAKPMAVAAVVVGACLILAATLTFMYGAKIMGYVGGVTVTPTNEPAQVSLASATSTVALPTSTAFVTQTSEPTLTVTLPTEPVATLDPIYSRDDRISGQFTYRGVAVAGIPVSLIAGEACDTNQVIQRTTTDAQGRYYFLNVNPGSYQMAINGWNDTDTPVEPYGQSCLPLSQKTSAAITWNRALHKTDLQITYPTEYGSIQSMNPTFQWQAYPGATSYEIILIQTSPTRTTIIGLQSGRTESTTSTSYTANLTLVPGNEYWLLVWASDGNGQIAVGYVYFEAQ